jgi:hypothetical protein
MPWTSGHPDSVGAYACATWPLQELNARATSANLKGDGIAQALALFDTNVELWTGRAAMIGVASLFAVEAVTGKVFF